MLKIKQKRTLYKPRFFFTADDMKALGDAAVMAIRVRIGMRGQDLDDTAMQSTAKDAQGAYSAAYKKRKRGVTSVRNLAETGKFLRQLHAYKASRKKVVVGWTSGYGKLLAEAHGKTHTFLGLSDRDKVEVMKTLQKLIAERLKTFNFSRRV